MIERKTWTVYRDGYRWTVQAKHLPDALRRACLQTDAMSGQQYVDAGTRREPCEAPAPDGLPIALRCFTHEIEALYCTARVMHVISVIDSITHAQALDVLARARDHYAAIQAAAIETTVRDEAGNPARLYCYKTGNKGRDVRIVLNTTCSRAGTVDDEGCIVWNNNAAFVQRAVDCLNQDKLIRWPRRTSAAEKTRVLAGVVYNAALDEYVTAMQAVLVFDTESTVRLLVPSPKRVDEMTEAELRERKAQYEAELAELSPNATARHEIAERIAAVTARLDVFDSIRDHGFDVGTVVDVLPAPWDDEQVVRRAHVVEVVIEHLPTYFGREPDTQHRRVVEFFDGSESIRPEVDRLRLVTI